MEHRSPAVYVIAVSLVVLVAGLVLALLPGPGLLVGAAGAIGMLIGLVMLMTDRREDGRSRTTGLDDGR